jgi:hypothetical protein
MDLFNASLEGTGEDESVFISQEEYETQKKHLEGAVANSQSAVRLGHNEDFKEIVMRRYLTEEPARLGALIASGRATPRTVEGAIEDLKAIAHFRTFLNGQLEEGRKAEDELNALEEARQEALAAEAGEA